MIEASAVFRDQSVPLSPKEMAEKLREIADQIELFSINSPIEIEFQSKNFSKINRTVDSLAAARHVISGRKIRNSTFGAPIFGEPSWDILLDLFDARQTMEVRSMKAVSVAAQAPLTTTLRYVECLSNAGLVEKLSDPVDGRRTLVRLSERGEKLICRALEKSFQNFPGLTDK